MVYVESSPFSVLSETTTLFSETLLTMFVWSVLSMLLVSSLVMAAVLAASYKQLEMFGFVFFVQ